MADFKFTPPPEQPPPSPTGLAPVATRPTVRDANFYDDLQQRVIEGANANYDRKRAFDVKADADFREQRRKAHADGTWGDFLNAPAAPARFSGQDPAKWMPRPNAPASTPDATSATRQPPTTKGTRAPGPVSSFVSRVFGRARGMSR